MMYNCNVSRRIETFFEKEQIMLDFLNNGIIVTLYPNGLTPTMFYIYYILGTLLIIAASYLLGSVNSAIIISRLLYKDDIRRHGSGNAGATNMLRTYGKSAALFTLLGDVMKTVFSVLFAAIIFGFNYVGGISTGAGFCYIAGLFTILGHIFPAYYGLKGGKGVLVTAAMALILSPVAFLILITLFIIIVYFSRYVSLGSVIVAILYPIVLHGIFSVQFGTTMPGLTALASILAAIIIVWCHRKNLERISNRTENKISFKKKAPKIEEAENDGDEE